MMKPRQWVIVVALLLLVVVAIAGLVITNDAVRMAAPGGGSSATPSERTTLVDERPLQTARKLSALAATPEEQRLSNEALRLADHEVDLEFASALRNATDHPPQATPQIRELTDRVSKAEAAVKADQDRVALLTKRVAAAGENELENLHQQLDLARAQAELDQDELDDAKEDLTRAGGDLRGKVQRLLDEHEATQQAADAIHANAANSNPPDVNYLADSLAVQVRAWNALREKAKRLREARQEALEAATSLSRRHDALEKQVEAEQPQKQDVTNQARRGLKSGDNATAPVSKTTATAALASLRHFSDDQKNLSDLDKRVQDQQELGETYASWINLVKIRQRASAHGMIQSAMWILLILLMIYLASRLLDRFFTDLTPERKRLVTLRAVIRFVVQAIGVLLILLVIFGPPNQMPTILGLAGAGLTVALKDFIVGFFGWFVLMGRNGIRVGDWVEINGVAGEVVEIGLLRTVLLETGNWADTGHPTGRRVAFVNSFAVEGHYFNFSTSGQWLWDELQVLIPSQENLYPLVDAIRMLVAKETEANGRKAEEEWQHATSHQRVRSFSAEPAINLRPTSAGVEVHVRYITRAHERYAMRTRLYQAVVELLHRKRVPQDAESSPAAKAERA
jgi:small-conductance mechanosensitive channel